MRTIIPIAFLCILSAITTLPVTAQEAPEPERTLYLVATSHLDTQWRWTIQETIDEYIPGTLTGNFELFDVFPNYTFSFEGAFRYMLMQEYYPDQYVKLKQYIATGRWCVAGSWVDAVDTNVPSPEALIRQALYGNGFFREEFGKSSLGVYLPDCFGFGYALPSIAAHCGLKGFSTQKLTWGSAYGTPFDIGMWEGVDGSALLSTINPGAYVSKIQSDLSADSTWLAVIDQQGEASGLYAGYKYFGVGDTGGAPDSVSVAWLEKALQGDGPITVKNVCADYLARTLTGEQKAGLPRYNGELLMTRHGVGCYTSQAAVKRWNRKNELLLDAAERACVIADWLGVSDYPRDALRENWVRFLWHQFHDDLTGTSIPEAYEFTWNDQLLCLNRAADLLTHAVGATASVLDTEVKGIPMVVFNPLSVPRQDLVDATVVFTGKQKKSARVYDPYGREVPSQVLAAYDDSLRILFPADLPPVGYAVYDVRPTRSGSGIDTRLKVTESTLENHRYLVRLNRDGDIASIIDKVGDRELLSAPVQLQLLDDQPDKWPAWEIDYDDVMAASKATLGGEVTIDIIEEGPVRVALQVTRTYGSSTFSQVISLAAGEAGNKVQIDNRVDWAEPATLLKAAFPLTTANDSVTYDLGMGVIQRGLNHEALYEVPAQQWADMTAPSGDYGVAIMNDCKYGWDHPDPAMLRLSLIHTPAVPDNWAWVKDEQSQDIGQHRFSYAIYGHTGDWRDSGVPWEAARYNQPLVGFQTDPHAGRLGKRFSFLRLKADNPVNPPAMVKALKRAENGDEIVVRFQELYGTGVDELPLEFIQPYLTWWEVDGTEQPVLNSTIYRMTSETPVLSCGAYAPRTFVLTLNPPSVDVQQKVSALVDLPYNLDAVSTDAARTDGDADGAGNSISGDLLPRRLTHLDLPFAFGPVDSGAGNAVSCAGQVVYLPQGDFNTLSLLVAAVGGQPRRAVFKAGEVQAEYWIPDLFASSGQWNNRLVGGDFVEDYDRIAPAFIDRTPVAWTGTHYHDGEGKNIAYKFTKLYRVDMSVSDRPSTLILPDDPDILVFAATVSQCYAANVRPVQVLYDAADNSLVRIHSSRRSFTDSLEVTLSSPNAGVTIRYTLDGSRPTEESSPYQFPIVIRETTTLKARAFHPRMNDEFVSVAKFVKHVPIEPAHIENIEPGLVCEYYEGEWDKLPDFSTLEPAKTSIASEIVIPEYARPEDFALRFSGYIEVKEEGMHDFFCTSDDGSALYVADRLIVNNDGLHGATEVQGEIALKPGYYPIVVEMFQLKGGKTLQAALRGPAGEKAALESTMLHHRQE